MQTLGQHPFVASSVLTRPNNTTAYAQNDLIASSATAGSIVVPSVTIPRDEAEIVEIVGGRLITNLTTGFTTFQGHIDLWSAAPTFTNGDNGAYAVATGAASWLGHMSSDVSDAYSAGADGAFLHLVNGASSTDDYARDPIIWARKPGDVLYWTLREIDSTGFTPIANQTFTIHLVGRLY